MEEIPKSVEDALVCWINTFPSLPKIVNSFDDLCDGLVFCYMINQIDKEFLIVSVKDSSHVTDEESKELFEQIKNYLKSTIFDEEASGSEDEVLNNEAIIFDHNKSEVLYLVRVILGLAMQCPQKNLFITRITELPEEVGATLSTIAAEVLESMQVPEDEVDQYVDDDHLKSFEEIMEEIGSSDGQEVIDDSDDWGEWNATETPADHISPLADSSELSEEKDKQIYALKEEIALLKEHSADIENENKKLLEEKKELLVQQEKMHNDLNEYKTQVLQLQMKLEEQQGTKAMETAANSSEVLRIELEKVEQENIELNNKIVALTKEINESRSSFKEDLEAAKNQISLLREENNQLQRVDQINQNLKKQLAEYKNAELSSSVSVSQISVPELEKRVQELSDNNKALQSKVIQYQQDYDQLLTQNENLKRQNAQYESDIQQLTQKNESLQILMTPSDDNEIHKEPSFSGFDELLSEKSVPPSGEVDIKKGREYMELSNDLLLANEKIIGLNNKNESLKREIIDLQRQIVELQEQTQTQTQIQTLSSSGNKESIPAEQYSLLVTKFELKDDELKSLRTDLERMKGDYELSLRRLEEMKRDKIECNEMLAASHKEIDELTASKEKLAENFRKSLLKLQQDEISIDKYKKLVEEQDKDMKNQQEVMFTTIHKLGESTIMKYYKSNLQLYRPKGWLARVRISQAKLF